MSSQKICYRCGGLIEQGVMASFDTDNCQLCSDLDGEEYSIQNKIYTREGVIEALKQGRIQGFDIAQNHHGERKPLHSFVAFSRFFLRSRTEVSTLDFEPDSAVGSKQQDMPQRKRVQAPVVQKTTNSVFSRLRFVFLTIVLGALGYYFVEQNPNFGSLRYTDVPSPLVSYLDTDFSGEFGTHRAFPKQGDIEKIASELRSKASKEWDASMLGQVLLDLTLLEERMEPALGDWIVHVQKVFPEEQGIHAAYLSWRFRFSQAKSWCSEIGTCTHEVCEALQAICAQQYSEPTENPYLQRFSVLEDIQRGKWPAEDALKRIPGRVGFGLLGDKAFEQRQFETALSYYKKAFQEGAQTEEDIFRCLLMSQDYAEVITLAQKNTYLQYGEARSDESKRLVVRAMIEQKKYEEAYALSATMKDRISVLQQHNLALLMNREAPSVSCTPQNHVERLYCARLDIMQENYEEALERIEQYPYGDPNRSMVELLIAMRRGDRLAMTDALKSFAFGSPEALRLHNAQTVVIPSISMEELNRTLRPFWKNGESKILHDWLFLQKTKGLFHGNITSSAICSAALQESVRSKQIQKAEEALQCLSHFDIDRNYIRFFEILVSHQRSPDLYPIQKVHSFLEESGNRSLLYWGMVHSLQRDDISLYQRRIVGGDNERFLFANRWLLSLREP